MRFKNCFVYLFICFLVLGRADIILPQSSQVLDRIMAIVDDDIILESEVTQAAFYMSMQFGIDVQKNPAEFENLRKEALTSLIHQKLLLIQADKDTVKVDERQIDAQLQQQMQSIIQQLGGEEKVEETFGKPLTKVRKYYRDEIEKNYRISVVREQKLAKLVVSRREVEEFFKTKRDSIGTMKETVDISHILVEAKPGEKARLAAMEKISEIRNSILAGEDFATLARQFSEDPGSAQRGGDLGFMARSDFVREFAEAAFALNPGEISAVIESQFGFHIIRLEEKRGDKIHTRHILIAPKPTYEDEVASAELIKKIAEELKNNANFEDYVAKYSDDASTKTNQGHLGVFEIDQLRETAKEFTFALAGVQVGEYADPVKTQYGFHILRLNNRTQPRPLDLEKDWTRIEAMALDFKKRQAFNQLLEEIKNTVFIEVKDKLTS